MKNFYALEPQFDSSQSFYGKAHVIVEDDNSVTLRSYETNIMNVKDGELTKLWDGWSKTTGRHITEFSKQHRLGINCKKDWDNLPLL